eukprot:scaffold42931_cov69-Phaeocystis_antarctica.AAC.7
MRVSGPGTGMLRMVSRPERQPRAAERKLDALAHGQLDGLARPLDEPQPEHGEVHLDELREQDDAAEAQQRAQEDGAHRLGQAPRGPGERQRAEQLGGRAHGEGDPIEARAADARLDDAAHLARARVPQEEPPRDVHESRARRAEQQLLAKRDLAPEQQRRLREDRVQPDGDGVGAHAQRHHPRRAVLALPLARREELAHEADHHAGEGARLHGEGERVRRVHAEGDADEGAGLGGGAKRVVAPVGQRAAGGHPPLDQQPRAPRRRPRGEELGRHDEEDAHAVEDAVAVEAEQEGGPRRLVLALQRAVAPHAPQLLLDCAVPHSRHLAKENHKPAGDGGAQEREGPVARGVGGQPAYAQPGAGLHE